MMEKYSLGVFAKRKIKQFESISGNRRLSEEKKLEMTARACRMILTIDPEKDFDSELLDSIASDAVESTFEEYVAKIEAD